MTVVVTNADPTRTLSIDERAQLGFNVDPTGQRARATFDMPDVRALYIATNKVVPGRGFDTDRMTLLPQGAPPAPVACGDHTCVLVPPVCSITTTQSCQFNVDCPTGETCVAESNLLIQTQLFPLFLPLNGAFDILCGTAPPDANGKCICDSQLRFVDPISLPGIGEVCVTQLPLGSCPLGEIDCDGGNDLDFDLEQFHRAAGSCTGPASCTTACDAHCASLGKVSAGFEACEGFCSVSGERCAFDSSCPVGENCGGADGIPHTGNCTCQCAQIGDGVADPAGSAQLNLGLNIDVEVNRPCGDGDVLISVGAACGSLTSASATSILRDANFSPGKVLGPFTAVGAPFSCTDLFTSVTTGGALATNFSFFDTAIGDLEALVTFSCQ